MAIRLEKGQKINLEKNNGSKLTEFCVGCNWGAIVTGGGFLGLGKKTQDVDLDLSCLMIDDKGGICDHIYSPLYRTDFLSAYGMPPGKVDSIDAALHHSGDDLKGDLNGNDGLDNEIITVDLNRVSPRVNQIFFFLNNCGKEDFSQIPYASIRMYEGTPTRVKEVFASYDVAAEPRYRGATALIMGKLYRRNGEWKFSAIGDAYPDKNICETIQRIAASYAK
ncbi:MAG: tellurium resistance TerZ family protein [Muribaculaceae bacterium]|nr:tellurium resistance TerZ family protein [Muribaculaceae bacterium]MDE5975554.1 tellurium resistance TerZ family protein [Muribaculaceae bacterium]